MTRIRLIALSVVLAVMSLLASTARPVTADEGTWSVLVDAGGLMKVERIQDLMEYNMDDESKRLIDQYCEVADFDPRTDIGRIHVRGHLPGAADNFDEEEYWLQRGITSIAIEVSRTGNLEGLLLALPGYSQSKFNDQEIHEVEVPDYGTIYLGFLEQGSSSSESATIVICRSMELMEDSIELYSPSSPSDAPRSGVPAYRSLPPSGLPSPLFRAVIQMDGLPEELTKELQEEFPSGFAKIAEQQLEGIEIVVAASEQEVSGSLTLEFSDSERIEQLAQLARAGVAFGQIYLEDAVDLELGELEQVKALADVLDSIEIKSGDNALELSLQSGTMGLLELLQDLDW